MGYAEMTSAELTAELKLLNLPSSGNKSEKLARLQKYENTKTSTLEQEVHDAVLVAEISGDSSLASRMKASREVFGTQIPMFGILVVTLLLLSIAGGGILGLPALMSWLEDEPEYTLIAVSYTHLTLPTKA